MLVCYIFISWYMCLRRTTIEHIICTKFLYAVVTTIIYYGRWYSSRWFHYHMQIKPYLTLLRCNSFLHINR